MIEPTTRYGSRWCTSDGLLALEGVPTTTLRAGMRRMERMLWTVKTALVLFDVERELARREVEGSL